MNIKDQFRFVRRNMKKNKTRVFMTVLAAAMGCAFLIVLASVGFGLQKSIVENITGGRVLTDIYVHGKRTDGNYERLTDKDVTYMESLPHVKAVTRRSMLQQTAQYAIDNMESSGNPIVVHMPSEIAAGFELDAGRMPEQEGEIVVGYDWSQSLRSASTDANSDTIDTSSLTPKELLGRTLEMTLGKFEGDQEVTRTFSYKIVGVGKKQAREWLADRNVYISMAALEAIEQFTGTSKGHIIPPGEQQDVPDSAYQEEQLTYDEIHVYATNADKVKGVVDKLRERDYATYSIVDQVEQANTFFFVIKIGLIIVGTIAVLIACIGIFNTMTMAVTERAQDIGIMKAIGAHPRSIRSIFLLESAYIGILGALIGAGVSYAISYIVNLVLPAVVRQALGRDVPDELIFSYIPPSLTVICIVISVGVAILSGMRPARRATGIDVLSALRRDL